MAQTLLITYENTNLHPRRLVEGYGWGHKGSSLMGQRSLKSVGYWFLLSTRAKEVLQIPLQFSITHLDFRTALILIGVNFLTSWLGTLLWFAITGPKFRDSLEQSLLVQAHLAANERGIPVEWHMVLLVTIFLSGIISVVSIFSNRTLIMVGTLSVHNQTMMISYIYI